MRERKGVASVAMLRIGVEGVDIDGLEMSGCLTRYFLGRIQ